MLRLSFADAPYADKVKSRRDIPSFLYNKYKKGRVVVRDDELYLIYWDGGGMANRFFTSGDSIKAEGRSGNLEAYVLLTKPFMFDEQFVALAHPQDLEILVQDYESKLKR